MKKPIETKVSDHEMEILLEETQAQLLSIAAIDLSVSSVKVRLTARHAQALDDVLRPEVARIVRSLYDGVAHSLGTTDQPDFCLRLHGLTIEGCRLTVSVDPGGLRQFRLAFSKTSGNPLVAFRHSPRADRGLSLFRPRIVSSADDKLTSERLFDEMLSQLYLPLINLNAYLRQTLESSIPESSEPFSHSVVQLKTRAETLQFAFDRLISEMMVEKYAGNGNHDPVASQVNAA